MKPSSARHDVRIAGRVEERRHEPVGLGRRHGRQESLPPAPGAGSGEHDQQRLQLPVRSTVARSHPRRSPRPPVQSPPSGRRPAPGGRCPSRRVHDERHPDGLGQWSGPCSGAGTVQGSRQVGPGHHRERPPEVGDAAAPAARSTAVSCTPIVEYSGSMLRRLGHARPASASGLRRRSTGPGDAAIPSPSLPNPSGTHPGRDRGGLAGARRARRSPPVPRVDRRPPQLAVAVPADRAGGKVGPADGDRPGSLHALDDRGVPTRIGRAPAP